MWDYPRPPRVEPASKPISVMHNGVELARSERALRVLEKASPPTFYIPRDDVVMKYLHATTGHTVCEFKGVASYFDLEVNSRVASRVAWTYEDPKEGFEQLRGCISFYASRVDAATSVMRRSRPRPETSTGAGSRPTSSVPSKESPAPSAGDQLFV